MDFGTWLMMGMIVGVVSTGWQQSLSFRRLILSVIIGVIGSVSGGVIGYIFYDATGRGFSLSVFSTSLILTSLIIISRRKIKQLVQYYRMLHPKILMLQDGKALYPSGDIILGSSQLSA